MIDVPVAQYFTLLVSLCIYSSSRRCNLLFPGLHDAGKESWEVSEEEALRFAPEKIGITVRGSEM